MSDYDYPDICYDEYSRASCAAHNRQECHICCMSFSMQNEEIDENPSDRDVGLFISDESLIDWHARMKVKMPRVFPEDDQVFGDDPGQHPYGTKLLAHFDGDKNKPMPCTIVGSRWKDDEFSSFPGMTSYYVDGREPFYIIWMGRELSQIGLMDAHMGDEDVGWKVVGHDPVVDARLDALARAHQNCQQGAESSDDDSMGDISSEDLGSHVETLSLQTINCHIRRTLKRIHDDDSMKPWGQSIPEFFVRFFMYSFSASEREHIIGGNDRKHDSAEIARKIKDYRVEESLLQPDNINFCTRVVLAQLVAYFVHDRYDSAILQNKRRTKFQAIELNNCHASRDHVPCMAITYATDPEGIENPTQYLRDDKIKVIEVPDTLARALENHLLNCVSSEGLNDIGSGLLLHEGFLVPVEIVPSSEGKTVSMSKTKPNIPDVNFGVELELSCASGNYQWRIASSIKQHAQVDIRIGHPSGKGGGKGGGSKSGGFAFAQYPSGKGGNGGGGKSGGFAFPHQKNPPKGFDLGGSNQHDKWKLVYDQSITPNVQNPHSLTFEIVSPILSGNNGLDALSNTMVVLADVACVRVNKSMGLHVHIEAKSNNYSLENMKIICQQFLLFEGVIDSFLPHHRRTGSEKCHSYFESNILSVMARYKTLEESLKAVAICQTRTQLYDLVNPGVRERYHKLNLQNLKTGRQPTIEFRQHHATKDEKEMVAWVRFCALFVVNAADVPVLNADDNPKDATFDALFKNIIRCPILQEYYSEKKASYEN